MALHSIPFVLSILSSLPCPNGGGFAYSLPSTIINIKDPRSTDKCPINSLAQRLIHDTLLLLLLLSICTWPTATDKQGTIIHDEIVRELIFTAHRVRNISTQQQQQQPKGNEGTWNNSAGADPS